MTSPTANFRNIRSKALIQDRPAAAKMLAEQRDVDPLPRSFADATLFCMATLCYEPGGSYRAVPVC